MSQAIEQNTCEHLVADFCEEGGLRCRDCLFIGYVNLDEQLVWHPPTLPKDGIALMVDEMLRAWLTPGLRKAVDSLLAAGVLPGRVVAFVRDKAEKIDSCTALAVEAYVERKLEERYSD